MSKELTGGFINRVSQDDGTVRKIFTHDELVGIPNIRRKRNETAALSFFDGSIAPKLLEEGETYIIQEFIPGELYERRAKRGDDVFDEAGKLLAKIHKPYSGNLPILEKYYKKKFEKAVLTAHDILIQENISIIFDPDWQEVRTCGITCLHKDFWLGNIIGNGDNNPKAIDWEFAGVGSPYEDFAIVDLWIIREFNAAAHKFWEGYGMIPDSRTVSAFLKLKCIEFLATTTAQAYNKEDADGFYHNKIFILRNLL